MTKGQESLLELTISTLITRETIPIEHFREIINNIQIDLDAAEDACKKAQAFDIISPNFRLVGNCLHAKNEYAENGWVFVKEIIDEKELEAWKEALKNGNNRKR